MDELTRIKSEIAMDRRGFLRKVLSGAVGGSLLLVIPIGSMGTGRQDSDPEQEDELFLAGKKFAFVVDITSCIGCGVCCTADKTEYEVPDGFYRTWVERYVIDDHDNVFVDSPHGGLNGYSVERTDIPNPARANSKSDPKPAAPTRSESISRRQACRWSEILSTAARVDVTQRWADRRYTPNTWASAIPGPLCTSISTPLCPQIWWRSWRVSGHPRKSRNDNRARSIFMRSCSHRF